MQLIKNESIATGMYKPKTTALFFDKLWIPKISDYFNDIPNEILVDAPSKNSWIDYSEWYWRGMKNNIRWDILEKKIITEISNETKNPPEFLFSSSRNAAMLEIVENMRKNFDIEIVPIFIEKTSFERSLSWLNYTPIEVYEKVFEPNKTFEYIEKQVNLYNSRQSSALEVCITNIPNALEENLSWKQILEIRKDKNSHNSIKRLRRWLNTEFTNKSENEIIETIEKNLEDYSFALKKHGVLTSIGSLTTIITSSASIINTLKNSPLELVSTSFILSASIFTFTAQHIAEYIEKKREPIAFLYDINKRIEKSK